MRIELTLLVWKTSVIIHYTIPAFVVVTLSQTCPMFYPLLFNMGLIHIDLRHRLIFYTILVIDIEGIMWIDRFELPTTYVSDRYSTN